MVSMELVLHTELNLREILALLNKVEQTAVSRFRIGSPCKFIRTLDITVHIVLPELVEHIAPKTANYLRSTSPRWGRSWRHW